MIDEKRAIEQLQQLKESGRNQRAYYDAYWSLASVYTYADQWGYISPKDNALSVSYLRNITDPQREDVRVTMNRIHADVSRLVAALNPEQLIYDLEPRGVAHMLCKIIGKQLMDKYLQRISALEVLREKNWGRFILGSVFVRRTLRAVGRPMAAGENALIRNFAPGVAVVYPWEVMRDPSAATTKPHRDEEIFCHEKPRTVEWVRRNFGVKIETEQTVGGLIQYQRQIQAGGGMGMDRHAMDSKARGVLVQETFYQDPDEPNDWPWVLFSYCDPSSNRDDVIPLTRGVIANPFYGLPFHGFHYDTQIQAPWGRGVPHLQIAGQDMLNMAVTWLLRMMVAGSGKWMVEKGTMTKPEAARLLNNRLDEVLWYQRSSSYANKPERSAPPVINPAVVSFINSAPSWMRDALNLTDVQFGVTSKRGESGEAITSKLSEANIPLESLRHDDDMALAELLYGLYVDLTNRARVRLDQVRDILGSDAPEEAVRSLLRVDAVRSISHITVHPATNRPTTPAQMRNDFTQLLAQQVIDSAEDARWEMMLRGVSIDTAMKNAYDQQLIEINQMVFENGEVRPNMSENHHYHRKTIEWYLSQPAALALDDPIKEKLNQHWIDHYEAELALAQGEAELAQGTPETAGQPSPPAMAYGQPPGMSARSVGPASPLG